MKWYHNLFIITLVIALISALGFIIYKQIEISQKQELIESQIVEQKQLVDGIMRSQSSWATKEDVESFVKSNNVNLEAIKEDLDKLNAKITAVNVILASSKPQHGTHIPTTPGPNTNPNPVDPKNPDPYGYLNQQQVLELEEDFSSIKVPIGTVGFSAWQKEPWNIDIDGREYKVTTVQGLDKDGKTLFYNKVTVKVKDKEYDIPITTAITKQVIPEAEWSWWNPKVFLTAGGSINVTELPVNGTFNAGLTFGFMSYGKFNATPDISILQAGVGYSSNDSEFAVIINPVAFNIGNAADTDILKNTYIGPSVQITHTGEVFTGANISVGF